MSPPPSLSHFFLLSALYLGGCAWVGFAFLTLLFRGVEQRASSVNGHLWLFFSLACGMTLHMSVLFLSGLAGQLDAPGMAVGSTALLALATVVVTLYAGVADEWRTLVMCRPNWLSTIDGAAHGFSLAGLFLLIASFALHAPGHWDDTMYHLPYAQYYLDHRQLQANEYLRYPLFPNHSELLFAFGLAYGGVPLAQAMATLPLFIIAVGLMGAGRQFLGSVQAGLLATGLLLYLGPISGTLGYAYVDDGLALFCWAALLALLQPRPVTTTLSAWIIVAALLAATAASIKFFGAIWAGLLGFFILLETRRLRPTLVFGLGVAILGSWWYVRSFWISGDPIHPAGGPLFGYFWWSAQDLLDQKGELSRRGVGTSLSLLWPALVHAQVTLIAPAFLTPLFFRRGDRSLVFAYGVFLAYFVFWFVSVQVPRYLAPLLTLACFLTILVFYRAAMRTLVHRLAVRWPLVLRPVATDVAVAVLVALMIPVALNRAQENMVQWGNVLESRAGYRLYQSANALIPEKGPRLVQVGFENGVFFFRGQAMGDWFGPARYSQFIKCTRDCRLIAPSAMLGMMAQLDSRMFIVNSRRFAIDLDAYRLYFDIRDTAKDGYLLTIKD